MIRKIWQLWKNLARILGVVNTFLLLTLTYVFLFGPAAVVVRVVSRDRLRKRAFAQGPFWVQKPPQDDAPETYMHPF